MTLISIPLSKKNILNLIIRFIDLCIEDPKKSSARCGLSVFFPAGGMRGEMKVYEGEA